MKKIALLLVALTFVLHYAAAQNLKFGKPSKEEWALTSCEEAPDAPAVVLCKTLSLTYELSASFSAYGSNSSDIDLEGASLGSNDVFTAEGTSMIYTVKMRTKILKDEGKGYANLDILYYYSKKYYNKRDDFHSFKVTLFSNEGGKVKKQNLDKVAFTDVPVSNDFMKRQVRIPQAKAGDIVEVQYELFSNRIAYIFDWQLQDEAIPVRYSSCELNIPSFLTFNVNAAIRKNVNAKVDKGSITYKKDSNDLAAPKTCFSNIYRIVSRNMIPWAADPIRQTKGTEIAQVKATISNAAIQGVPYPLSQPEGLKWITLFPKE